MDRPSVCLSTDVLLRLFPTFLTLNVAAPVELAVTPFGDDLPARVEPPSAAHELAAVDRLRRLIAKPALSAERAGPCVRLAEVGRRIDVDKVGICVRLVEVVLRNELAPRPDALLLHLCRAVELVLKRRADVAEGRH